MQWRCQDPAVLRWSSGPTVGLTNRQNEHLIRGALRSMRKAILIAAFLFALCAVWLWFLGRPAYRHYRETRSLERAKAFLAQGDLPNARLSARQTLLANPSSVEATKIMASLAEQAHSPAALDWRRRVVELAPTVENKLLLASTALRAQGPPFPLATELLGELSGQAKGVAAYQVLSAELALKSNHPALAEACFAEASRLEPANEQHQLNLAVLRLHSTNAVLAAQARETLERLQSGTNLGPVALRWLLAEALTKRDLPLAQKYSSDLLSRRPPTLEDRLQHLTILFQGNDPKYAVFLDGVKKSATNAPDAYGVAEWFLKQALADDAMRWLTNLPAKLRTEQPVPLALVDCYQARKDWPGLEAFLQNQDWGDLDFMRFAYLSLAASKQQQELAAEARWRMGIQKAGDRLGALIGLLRMAEVWGRAQAKEDLLWEIFQHFPKERWAPAQLERLYLAAGNTRGLNKLAAAQARYDAGNYLARTSFAATAMLLKINLSKAYETAKELYSQHPGDVVVASTYAFSLHLQGRTKEGLAILEKLKAPDLESSAASLCYGVLLSANGQSAKAEKYLAIAQRFPLLPEEKALVAAAAKGSGS